MWIDDFERLPDVFRKPNIKKYYKLMYSGYDSLDNTLNSVKHSRDIDKAFGKTLDYIGRNVGVLRVDENDELFKMLIKITIIANRSKGDIPTINEVGKTLLGDAFIGVKETWNDKLFENEPAAIEIQINANDLGLPHMIGKTISGGVGLKWSVYFQSNIPSFLIGAITTFGEETTILPYMPDNLYTIGKIPVMHNLNILEDNTTIYPKK